MPNISGHMAVAKRVSEILGIDSDDFYRGNLLPDLYEDKIKSHYKVKGELFYIPDIEEAKKNLNLKDLNDLGVLSHLLLDKYYFGEYLKDNSFFRDKSIYKDYDIINKDIVNYFDLDVERIINSFKHYYLSSFLSDFFFRHVQGAHSKTTQILYQKSSAETLLFLW